MLAFELFIVEKDGGFGLFLDCRCWFLVYFMSKVDIKPKKTRPPSNDKHGAFLRSESSSDSGKSPKY